jgi:hypothetical protein
MPDPSPPDTRILLGKDGPQLVDNSSGKRWTDEAEEAFFDHLAATCNVTASAKVCGFTCAGIYKRRRTDPAFARKWQAALEQGHARIAMLLAQRAAEALEGFAPDPESPIPQMTVKDALAVLGHHRRTVENLPRSRRQWARPKSLDEMSAAILARLEAIAPAR